MFTEKTYIRWLTYFFVYTKWPKRKQFCIIYVNCTKYGSLINTETRNMIFILKNKSNFEGLLRKKVGHYNFQTSH